jgi:thermitase
MTKYILALGLVSLTYHSSFTQNRELATSKSVLSVEELKELALKPYGKNWGLNKYIGIDAYEAWKETQGSSEILIGVVDTGIDINHPQLKQALWVNQKESGPWTPKNIQQAQNAPNCFDLSCNKIDDDKNGLIDDIHGWDFVRGEDIKKDTHGHGTHIAGIIAGIIAGAVDMKSGRGGVAPKVKISAYSYFIERNNLTESKKYKDYIAQGNNYEQALKEYGSWNIQTTGQALKQAINHGAKIINYSAGGYSPDAEELKILKEAEAKNILVVVAAGNGDDFNNGLDMDDMSKNNKYYPCAYNLSNIICVGNINSQGKIVKSSNQGIENVHIFAPGQDIYSTLPGGSFGPLTGTSQATAFVSGVAALVLSKNPNLKPKEVKALLMNTSDKVDSLKYATVSQGKVNASEAIKNINNIEKFSFNEKTLVSKLLKEKKDLKQRSISQETFKQINKVKKSLEEYIED